MKKLFGIILSLSLVLPLAACGSDSKENDVPPDLEGQWKQVNSTDEDSFHGAIIDGDEIEIYFVSNDGDSRTLYWAGSFTEPDTAEEPYSWVSQNDKDKTGRAILVSPDDTKAFTYADGQISYSSSMMGTTTTVRLEKEEWEPGLEIEKRAPVDSEVPEEKPQPSEEEPAYNGIPYSVAGVEFSIPDYYKKDSEASTDDQAQFDVKNGDIVTIGFSVISSVVSEEKFEEQMYAFEDSLFTSNGLSVEDENDIVSEEILLAGLPGRSFSAIGKLDEVDATIHLDFVYNPPKSQAFFILFMQAGNPQYDYLRDYQKMLDTATLVMPENSDSPPEAEEPDSPSGIRPEFQEAMDAYEEFMNEYVDFMNRYANAENPLGMLSEYVDYMSKYAEKMEEFDKIDNGDLSTEELSYYIEVQSRVSQKLLTIAQ